MIGRRPAAVGGSGGGTASGGSARRAQSAAARLRSHSKFLLNPYSTRLRRDRAGERGPAAGRALGAVWARLPPSDLSSTSDLCLQCSARLLEEEEVTARGVICGPHGPGRKPGYAGPPTVEKMHQTQLNKAISQAQGATTVGLLPPPLLPLPPGILWACVVVRGMLA